MNPSNHERYDVVILGTGPAGLQAAIHAARANGPRANGITGHRYTGPRKRKETA